MKTLSFRFLQLSVPKLDRSALVFMRLPLFALLMAGSLALVQAQETAPEELRSNDASDAEAQTTNQERLFRLSELKAFDIEYGAFEDEYTLLEILVDDVQYQFPVKKSASHRALSLGTLFLVADSRFATSNLHAMNSLASELNGWGWDAVVLSGPELADVINAVDKTLEAQGSPEPNTRSESNNLEGAASNNETQASTGDSVNKSSTNAKAVDSPQLDFNAKHHQNQLDEVYMHAYAKFLDRYIAKAKEHLEHARGYKAFYAQGIGAQALVHLLSEREDIDTQLDNPDAIVLSNAFWPHREINQTLPKQIAKLPMPVLDLVSQWDNKWAQQTEDARRIRSIQQIKTYYRQRQLSDSVNSYISYPQLAKEMHGYFSYLGW
ncbi:DUF3530 family protein [Ningiella sp. W23]|uniref:DUF3530 family protein n=1 Tax=Ningiella sp. W23 TaxID=3023715 RepID=UPI003757ECC3